MTKPKTPPATALENLMGFRSANTGPSREERDRIEGWLAEARADGTLTAEALERVLEFREWALDAEIKAADEELKSAQAHRLSVGLGVAQDALRRLVAFAPGHFPLKVDAYGQKPEKDVASAPFFSETYLYSLLGKDDARAIRGLISEAARAVGIERGLHELEGSGDELARLRRKAHRARVERLRARVTKLREIGHTLAKDRPCAPCKALAAELNEQGRGLPAALSNNGCRGVGNLRALQDADPEWEARGRAAEFLVAGHTFEPAGACRAGGCTSWRAIDPVARDGCEHQGLQTLAREIQAELAGP